MKFLIDECVGFSVVRWLEQNNYNASFIAGALSGSTDEAVLKKAFRERGILITCDKDFGEMIFRNRKKHCGIILLRLVDEQPSNKIIVLKRLLDTYALEIENNFTVATETAIRMVIQGKNKKMNLRVI